MRTPVCDLLGLDVPIAQAPMGGASCPALAAAVSNAGGLGTMPVGTLPAESVAAVVEELRARTERPFAVNLLLTRQQEERLDAALAAGAPLINFGWGDPGPLVARAQAGGAMVLVTVGSPAEARAAADLGADVIVAQGWEAGGHVWGDVATLPLVPATVDAVAPVPVLAGGGIADGRGVAAALALGAQGAWIGTRFLLAEEAAVHDRYRELLLAAETEDTVHSSLFDVGWRDAPHRTLRNSTYGAWEQAGRPEPGSRPGEGEVVAQLANGADVVRYASQTPSAGVEGDVEAMSTWAGQGVGLARRVQSAAEIVRELAQEADRVMSELAKRV
ncbi:MAG TPA: nitronate monooxygenase [Gaiellaceae bacterium]|nr:nitronate monooxygenase [Gaiellaceae bacterium]